MKAILSFLLVLVAPQLIAQTSLEDRVDHCLLAGQTPQEDSTYTKFTLILSEQHGGCIVMPHNNYLRLEVFSLYDGSSRVALTQGDSVVAYKFPLSVAPLICYWLEGVLHDTSYCGGYGGGIPVIVQATGDNFDLRWNYCKSTMDRRRVALLSMISSMATSRRRIY